MITDRELTPLEQIQQAVARLLATSPAGQNLQLIGGFRYRLLDQSARMSRDIDYHWDGDLDQKQAELISLFQRRLVPDIRRRFGYESDVRSVDGPADQSPLVRTVELAFWFANVAYSRIEVPVEITRIVCLDAPVARTAEGVVYPTASDADVIESKVIALLNRTVVEHRDFCDVYLFTSHLAPNAAQRVHTKLATIGIPLTAVVRRQAAFRQDADYHIREIQAVIADQLEPSAAANIQAAGGAKMVFEQVMDVLLHRLRLSGEALP